MTSALEEIKQIDLEEWLTLATAPSPTKLKQGQSPNMQNVWTDEKPGSVITAPGFIKVGQAPTGGNPITFCIDYFNSSTGTQIFVVSDNHVVWTTLDFQNYTAIMTNLSIAFQLRGLVIRDKLWMTNGSEPVFTFDGTNVVILDGSGSPPDVAANVPKGRYIAYHDERVWIYHVAGNRSAVYFSSLTDSSGNIIAPDVDGAWDTTDNFLQISEGDADFGTGMIVYRGYLFLFKQYSIWRLVGYDEYTYSRVKTRSSTGTRFNESVQILDSLVHLIGVDGIYIFDGEESERISDIIDPDTASQTAFGFNQLQQPNQNSQFWKVSSTADWNGGTVPTNLVVNNSITLEAADDSQADFEAGATLTNIDTTTVPGSIQLTHSGINVAPFNNVARDRPVVLDEIVAASQIGSLSTLVDGDLTNVSGISLSGSGGHMTFQINFSGTKELSRIIFRRVSASTSFTITFEDDMGASRPVSDVSSGSISSGSVTISPITTTDITFNMSPFNTTALLIRIVGAAAGGVMTLTEVEVYETAFELTGKFVSKALDLGIEEAFGSLGIFNVIEALNAQTTSYFTQSSDDGISWEAETTTSPGGVVSSTPRRYLRWGVNFSGDGSNTPQISAVYLTGIYTSPIHDTGGNIFGWGPLQADRSTLGQTISFYYRTATTSPGISTAIWNLIVPGGVLTDPIANQFVQFRILISGGDQTHLPFVTDVTINWITGSGSQAQTLQNVASTYWRNRYWLSAAGVGATSNDTILVRGKKTFQSPWMLKDWNILSFTRFQDSLYGGSSLDGSIYQLDSGYSKAGSSMDSYFETGDFVFGGFTANFLELDVEVERLGSWSLSVGWSVDNGNTWMEKLIDLSMSTFDDNYIKRINMNETTTRIRFRFRTNGADTPFQVHRCIAYYKLESGRGSIRGDYMAAG